MRSTIAILILAAILSIGLRAQTVNNTFAVAPTYLLANCTAPAPAFATFCPTGDGHIYFAPAGSSAFVCIAGCAAAVGPITKVTLNNMSKTADATGNVSFNLTTPTTVIPQ